MQIGKHSSNWLNSAKRRRVHAKARAKLCSMLGWPVDCIATTGEILQAAREQRDALLAGAAR